VSWQPRWTLVPISSISCTSGRVGLHIWRAGVPWPHGRVHGLPAVDATAKTRATEAARLDWRRSAAKSGATRGRNRIGCVVRPHRPRGRQMQLRPSLPLARLASLPGYLAVARPATARGREHGGRAAWRCYREPLICGVLPARKEDGKRRRRPCRRRSRAAVVCWVEPSRRWM
jgi:hypothetical protein